MKKDNNLEINPPALAIRFEEYGSEPVPNFETMPKEEIQKYLQEKDIEITDKHRKRFADIFEGVQAKIRLEEARVKLANRREKPGFLASVTERIATLSKADLVKELRERLSSPGISSEVYARNLEETPEEDLRTLLADLERAKLTGDKAEHDKGSGDSI